MPAPHAHSSHFSVTALAGGVYAVIDSGRGTAVGNAGIIDLGDETLVFDTHITPLAARELRKTAEALTGNPVRWVVNSHYHNDHIRGNQIFQDAHILASEGTRRQIQIDGIEELEQDSSYAPQRAAELEAQIAASNNPDDIASLTFWADYFRAITDSLPGLKLTLPDCTFENSARIYGSRRYVEVHCYGAGHTASDSFLVVPDAGVAFLGDLLFVACHPFLADGNPVALLDYLARIEQLNLATFVPGHGPVGTKTDITRLTGYLNSLMQSTTALIADGGSAEDAAALPIPDAFSDWALSVFYSSNMRFLHEFLTTNA